MTNNQHHQKKITANELPDNGNTESYAGTENVLVILEFLRGCAVFCSK